MTTERRLLAMGFSKSENGFWKRGKTELSEYFMMKFSHEEVDSILQVAERREDERVYAK